MLNGNVLRSSHVTIAPPRSSETISGPSWLPRAGDRSRPKEGHSANAGIVDSDVRTRARTRLVKNAVRMLAILLSVSRGAACADVEMAGSTRCKKNDQHSQD